MANQDPMAEPTVPGHWRAPMFDSVRLALGRSARPDTVYECRHCGTTVGHADDDCPTCGSTEVASYEL